MTIRETLLTLGMIAAMRHVALGQDRLNGPPTIRDLGSNVTDGTVSVECAGNESYSELSCNVYHLSLDRMPIEEYQTLRAALQKDLATTTDAYFQPLKALWCNAAIKGSIQKDITSYSPGRAEEVRNRYKRNEGFCGCATKDCYISVRLEQQTQDLNECTFSSTVFTANFVKVGDRKWVSNNGPEGICGVVSVLTIEHEPNYANLWTYTEQRTYTNNGDGLCKGLANSTTLTYSWKSEKAVRLKCEEIKFTTNPGLEQLLIRMRKTLSASEEKTP